MKQKSYAPPDVEAGAPAGAPAGARAKRGGQNAAEAPAGGVADPANQTDQANQADQADRARCALQVVHLCLMVGALATGVWGVAMMVESNYTPPPLPAAYVVGQLLVVPAAALALASAVTLGAVLGVYKSCTPDNTGTVTRASFALVWGLAIAAFATVRFWIPHPHTLSACPCPAFHARLNATCVSCPGFEAGVCEDADCVCGNGVCSERTAQCSCSANWQVGPNQTCAECSSRAIDGSGGACSRCSARFKPDARGDCTLCRNGYVNGPAGACSQCHPHFAPRVDDAGAIVLTEDGAQICSPVGGCVDDQRVGPMCTQVAERCDAYGDVGAQLANANNLMVAPLSFTSNGQACDYDHDCDSYNCLGWCAYGEGGLEGTLCQEDADCLGGKCRSRTCGAEYRVGDDTCRCSRAGYLAPKCEKCPGFNGVWSASTCGGRGTCAALFVDGTGRGFLDTYSHLECVCAKPAGVLTEFPKWSGDKCARAVESDGATAFCAEGFFGPQCDKTCPSDGGASAWGGIAACDSRGVCEYDAGTDTAQCVCDQDARPNGDGFFHGESCAQCFGQHFYGQNCQSCPKLSRTSDCVGTPAEFLLFTDPDQCFASCTTGKTCDSGKEGTGMCLT